MILLKDPLCFKESLLISLEVLPEEKYKELRSLTTVIPNTSGALTLDTSTEVEDNLSNCINDIKKTKTYFWLREDFKNTLYDIERQLKH